MNPYVISLIVGFILALLIQDARIILIAPLFWLLYALLGWTGLGVFLGLVFVVVTFDA